MKVRIRNYAVFREQRGQSTEEVSTSARTVGDLYRELGLSLKPTLVRAAVNGEFADMNASLHENDEVVFIPPVAGG